MNPLDTSHILYTPAGAMSGTMGDSQVFAHGGKLHLFHLELPNHSQIAHAVSRDGFRWEPADPALFTGANGCFDDDMLWTMAVVKHPGRELFLMYYTGCSRREHGQVQRIGLATSPDLIRWERFSNGPILEAATPFYNADPGRVGFVSFRDPFVFWDDRGGWHMVVTARTAAGDRFLSGCLAHATSEDGFEWRLQPPLFAPGEWEDLEVPCLVRGPKGWALFFNDFTRATTHCRIAETLAGPWRRPRQSQPLPARHFVWRFADWKGRLHLWSNIRARADWPVRYVPGGAFFTTLGPAKELLWSEAGEPVLRSWSEWESLALEDWRPWPGSGRVALGGNGRAVSFGGEPCDHFLLEGDLDGSQCARFGILFRADEAGEQFQSIELDPPRARAELHLHEILRPGIPRLKTRGPTLQQASGYPPQLDRPAPFRLLVCGEYLEFSLNGQVLLSEVSYARKSGRIGFFQIEGAATFENVRLRRLAPPWQEPVHP